MSNERQLNTAGEVSHAMWQDAAIETIENEDVTEAEQARLYGRGLADLVAMDSLEVVELRQLAAVYNRLDREVFEVAGANRESLADTADYLEATARRIGHQAAKEALDLTGSRRRLTRYKLRHASRLGLRVFNRVEADSYALN